MGWKRRSTSSVELTNGSGGGGFERWSGGEGRGRGEAVAVHERGREEAFYRARRGAMRGRAELRVVNGVNAIEGGLA